MIVFPDCFTYFIEIVSVLLILSSQTRKRCASDFVNCNLNELLCDLHVTMGEIFKFIPLYRFTAPLSCQVLFENVSLANF